MPPPRDIEDLLKALEVTHADDYEDGGELNDSEEEVKEPASAP